MYAKLCDSLRDFAVLRAAFDNLRSELKQANARELPWDDAEHRGEFLTRVKAVAFRVWMREYAELLLEGQL